MTEYRDVLLAGDLGTFRGGSGFPIKFQGQASGDLPFFKVSDMNKPGNELFLRQANNYVSEAQRLAIGAVQIPAGSIVFAKVGAAIFLERKRILVEDSCIDNNMAAFIVDKKRLDVRFAHYLLSAFKMGNLVATTALPSINGQQLSSIPLLVPKDIRIQREIASVLEDMDDQIATLEHLIAKKQSVKQGMMQQLLTGRTRLPGFADEWAETRLGEVSRFGKGSGLPKADLSPSGITQCIHYGELFTLYGAEIDKIKSRTNTRGNFVYSERLDILMPTSDVTPDGLAKASCIHKEGVALGGDILIIRADKSRVYGPFIAHLIRYEVDQVLRLVTGSTVYHLYASDMQNFELRLPSVEEQQAIVSALRAIDEEIGLLHQKLEKAREMKSGMMQQLLTGRVRLPVEVAV